MERYMTNTNMFLLYLDVGVVINKSAPGFLRSSSVLPPSRPLFSDYPAMFLCGGAIAVALYCSDSGLTVV